MSKANAMFVAERIAGGSPLYDDEHIDDLVRNGLIPPESAQELRAFRDDWRSKHPPVVSADGDGPFYR